jgi:organic radical activating enzyme
VGAARSGPETSLYTFKETIMFRSIRIGFATNSSSSHSVVFHPGPDGKLLDRIEETPIDSFSYGDSKYCFISKKDKAIFVLASGDRYFGSNHSTLEVSRVLDKHGLSHSLINEAKSIDLPIESGGMEGFHQFEQSGITLPEWLDFMLSDQIVMYGYNDNYEDPMASILLRGHGVQLDWGDVWRRDGKALVGFNRHNGTKVRWSPEGYEKSTTPELVDLKITDFCGYGCSFCYQGSTKAGMHAPLSRIEGILDQLAAMNIFELAIGGGEPAHHPEFADIIRAATERDITANFTAYGTDWTKNADIMSAINDTKGCGVGISVHSKRDLVKMERVREALLAQKIFKLQVMAQSVVGATPYATTEALLEECVKRQMPLLLLGYKTTGRGADFGCRDVSDDKMKRLLEKAQSAIHNKDGYDVGRGFHLSVDTAFLDRYGHILDELEVPKALRTSPEGRFSMYVDAVTDTCGPSSYCEAELMEPIGNIRTQFANW